MIACAAVRSIAADPWGVAAEPERVDQGGMMLFSDYLAAEWRPALGCTEPAAIAYAAACASALASGTIEAVRITCDSRMYKNCYAVGLPNSGGRVGIRWAAALGVMAALPEERLEVFRHVNPGIVVAAEALLNAGAVTVKVDRARDDLYAEAVVHRSNGRGRAILERNHTRITFLERDGQPCLVPSRHETAESTSVRHDVAALGLDALLELARSISTADRAELRRGVAANLAIAEHGLQALPPSFVASTADDERTRIAALVAGGVLARMSGEDMVVMTLAGSGNKGITCSLPIALWGAGHGSPRERIDEALALGCLLTSATTHRLGPLSAMCGGANAAGIGAAGGLVYLGGGNSAEVSLAINTMVGNLAGMICDGAKIGCAMKTMTAADAAFRAATLALAGVGIPVTDGIVGASGLLSLDNLGQVAAVGMAGVDAEVLRIMCAKQGDAWPRENRRARVRRAERRSPVDPS